MILSASSVQDSLTKKKKQTTENYFDIREENAVRLFLTASTFEEKNKILGHRSKFFDPNFWDTIGEKYGRNRSEFIFLSPNILKQS